MKLVVGFSKPKTWKPFAWAIMKFSGTPYSHAFVQLDLPNASRKLIFQASHTMVNFMGQTLFDAQNEIVEAYEVMPNDVPRVIVVQFMVDNIGKPYNIRQVLGIALVKIVKKLTGRSIKNPFADGKAGYVCTEIAGVLMEQLGYKIDKDSDLIEFKDLRDALLNNGVRIK